MRNFYFYCELCVPYIFPSREKHKCKMEIYLNEGETGKK